MNIPQRHRTHRHKQLIGQRINNRPHNRLHVVLSSNVPVNKVGDTRVREQQQRGGRLASSYIVPNKRCSNNTCICQHIRYSPQR